MKNEQEKIILEKGEAYFNAAAQIGDCIYYSAKYANGLFRANLKTGKSEFITMFDTETKIDIHKFAFSVNNEVWFIPFKYGDKIAVFNTDTYVVDYIDIPEPKKAGFGSLFMNYVIKDDLVWLVPGSYEAFLGIRLEDREITVIDLPIGDYKERAVMHGYEYDNKIYLCPWAHNRILYLDLISAEVKALDVVIQEKTYRNIFIVNDTIYLFPRKISNEVMAIDLKECVCSYKKIAAGNADTQIPVIFYDAQRNHMFLFPYFNEKRIYVLNMDSFEVNQIEINHDDSFDLTEQSGWWDLAQISDDTFLLISNQRSVPILKYHNNEFTPFLLDCPKDIFVKQLLDLIKKDEYNRENKSRQGNIGEKIYQAISSDIP